jgi:hypothetical protein
VTPEALVKRDIKRALDKYPRMWYYMPVASRYSVAGIPDFVGCYKGRFFAIEAKAAKGRTTPLQDRTIHAIDAAYGSVGVVQPMLLSTIEEQVATILKEADAAETHTT